MNVRQSPLQVVSTFGREFTLRLITTMWLRIGKVPYKARLAGTGEGA